MIQMNNTAQILHDKVTRGDDLTQDEAVILEAWYMENDQAEQTLLRHNRKSEVNALRSKIQAGLSEVQSTARYIQHLTQENETLEHELDSLREKLQLRTQKA